MQSLATLVCLLPLFYNLSNLPLFVFKLGLCVELGVVEDCVAVLYFLLLLVVLFYVVLEHRIEPLYEVHDKVGRCCAVVPDKAGNSANHSPDKLCHKDNGLDYVLKALVDKNMDKFKCNADNYWKNKKSDCP